MGSLVETVTALDPETQTSFSTTVLPGLNNVAVNWYNDGMVVSNRSHSAVVTETRYDALRRETARIDGRGNVSRTRYDALGRVAATVDALTNATAYAYDAMGRVAAVTNALGEVTTYTYDLRGNRIGERGATYPVDYAFDCYGNKIAMTTYRDESLATGDVTHWLYDESSGTLTNKLYADGQGPRYEYDANGRLTKRTWARGVETFYSYDGWGNLTNTTYSDNTPTIALRYDAMGRQVEAHDAAGVTTFAYDDYGANTNETVIGVAGTNVIERFYDEYGRNAGYALNGVRQTTLAYDSATGRLATMRTGEGRASSRPQDVSFNDFIWEYLQGSDLKSQLTYPNGLTASWTYDANNQLLQVRNATPSATISQYDYTYDSAGRRIARAHSGAAFAQADTIDYAYNAKSELTNAVAVADASYTYAYDFDEIGNRRTSSECGVRSAEYAANELNQYTAISTDTSALFVSPREIFTPLFDPDGNQTLVKTATGIWQVTYNGENRPILWTCGTTNIVMSYDRMGRRVTKNDQRFVYDGYLQIANHRTTTTTSNYNYQSTPNPSTYTFFIWDPTEPVATRPLVWLNSAFDTSHSALYYTHDGNKNVSEVIAQDGAIAAHYEYAPFGAVTVQTGESAAANPWRFSSEFMEDDTLGLLGYVHRFYDADSGRWLSRDPIEEDGGKSIYAFCINRPVSVCDLLGNATLILEEVKKKYRDMVQTARDAGHHVAADNLEYFLNCNGGVRTLSWEWLRGYGPVITAERRNRNRFESIIKEKAKAIADGERIAVYDYFDATETANALTELYYASGTFTITSYGEFNLSRTGCKVTITGNLDHRWWDLYDWHNGLDAYVPGFGRVDDSEAIFLENNGEGKSFEMESWWTQSLKGTYSLRRYLWNVSSFDWSEPRVGNTGIFSRHGKNTSTEAGSSVSGGGR